MVSRPQRTLKKEVALSGTGIHTGKEVLLRLLPAAANTGIVFQRIDLPGQPTIPALLSYVQETSRSTTIGCEGASVQTVEHLMAALSACQIDNVLVQVTEGEPPSGDGSAACFVALLEEAGVEEQEAETRVYILQEPLYYTEGETHLVALPSNEYRISCTLHYPHTPAIGSQYLSLEINEALFKKGIAPCRTFALYEELRVLVEKGLIRGGTLENAVVIKDKEILNKEGLRFPDEMVRHKILDLIGDLALIGYPLRAHVIAIRSGHRANVGLGKRLVEHFGCLRGEGNG